MNNAAAAGAGIFIIFLSILSLVVAMVWIVFPFIVIGKFNKLIKLQEQSNARASSHPVYPVQG